MITTEQIQRWSEMAAAPHPVFVLESLGVRLILIGSGPRPKSGVQARAYAMLDQLGGQFTGNIDVRYVAPEEITTLDVLWRLGGMECCWGRLRELGLA